MSFSVDPAAVERFATRMGDRATNAGSAQDYAGQHITGQGLYEGVLFQQVSGILDDIGAKVGSNLGALTSLCRASSTELDRAAMKYANTDQQTSANLDSTYG